MFRDDGRKHEQMRDIQFQIGFDNSVNGSCHYKQGLTEVICLINGPKQKTQDQLIVIEYSVSPFSSIDSKRNSKFDKEFNQFAENLRHSFQNLIFQQPNQKSEIIISVCVIQNDGSQKSAIFNAINLALLDSGVQMKDFLVSCTVGLVNGNILHDLTQEETKNVTAELVMSYQSRKQKTDFFELKSQKVNSQEVEQLLFQSKKTADDLYKYLRSEVLKKSVQRLLM